MRKLCIIISAILCIIAVSTAIVTKLSFTNILMNDEEYKNCYVERAPSTNLEILPK